MNKGILNLATEVATASVTPKGDILMDLDKNNNAIIHRPTALKEWVCALGYTHKTGEWKEGIYCDTIYDAVIARQKFTPKEMALPLAVLRFERHRGNATMWCSTTLDNASLVFNLKLDAQDQLVIEYNETTLPNLQKQEALEAVRELAITTAIDCSFITDCENGGFVYANPKAAIYLQCEDCGDMFPHTECEGKKQQLCQCCQRTSLFTMEITVTTHALHLVEAHTEEEAKVLTLREWEKSKIRPFKIPEIDIKVKGVK